MAYSQTSRVVSVGLLIIALLVGLLVAKPLRTEVLALSQGLVTQQAELDVLNTEIASLLQVEAELPQAESERERILSSVPSDLNQDQLVEDLDAIAQEVGISLNSMSFSLQSSELNQASIVSISANFTGNYDDLKTLLKALETNERLLKVSSIGVQLGEITETGYTMTFTVMIEAYYQD